MKPFAREYIQSIRDGAAAIVARMATPRAHVDVSPEMQVVRQCDAVLAAETESQFQSREAKLRRYIRDVRQSDPIRSSEARRKFAEDGLSAAKGVK